MNTNKRAERARIEALDVALDRELAQCGTTDEQRLQFSDWFHKTFASPPMEFYPFAEAAWYAGQSALAQQAPTPVETLVREIHGLLKRGERTEDHGLIGNLRCILDHLIVVPDTFATVEAPTLRAAESSEPAAPVDARDALGALANINDLACFGSEEDTSTRGEVLLQIGQIARAALTRQAEAPAERKKT